VVRVTPSSIYSAPCFQLFSRMHCSGQRQEGDNSCRPISSSYKHIMELNNLGVEVVRLGGLLSQEKWLEASDLKDGAEEWHPGACALLKRENFSDLADFDQCYPCHYPYPLNRIQTTVASSSHNWCWARGVPYGTGERSSMGVSSANEARTACYVLYRVRRRWLQHEGRKRSLLQDQRRTTLQRH
jgi:hypothetical protein